MRLDSFCTDTVEDHEFLDNSVQVHVHTLTMYKWNTIMMVLITCKQQIMVSPCM